MLRWVFGADTQPFRRGLDQMRTETKGFASSIKGQLAAALGIGAIIAGFRNLFVEMDRVQKLGLRFGESAESIQKVGLAADLAGSDIEGVAKAITVATRNANEAANGNKEYAESFARMGIDAKSFVNLPMEEKLAILARAFEEGSGAGENLANMMEVLGRSGGDLIPLLSQGMEELQDQFDNTSTASQSTVDSIAAFNDQITKAKQTAQVAGAEIISFFRLSFGALGAYIGFFIGNAMTTLETLIKGATDAGKVVAKTLSGDLSGAADAARSFAGRFKTAFDEVKTNGKATADVIAELYDEIYNAPGKKSTAGPDVEGLAEKAEESLKIEEEKKKLAEEIAKLEEDARMRTLSLEEKILELKQKQAEAAEAARNSEDETVRLESRKEELEIAKELEQLTAKKDELDAEAAKKMRELEEAEAKRLADESEASAKEKEDNRISTLENAKSELSSISGPSLATSSLASIAAGGSVNLIGVDTIEQRKVDLLAIIAANTSRSDNGSPKYPDPY